MLCRRLGEEHWGFFPSLHPSNNVLGIASNSGSHCYAAGGPFWGSSSLMLLEVWVASHLSSSTATPKSRMPSVLLTWLLQQIPNWSPTSTPVPLWSNIHTAAQKPSENVSNLFCQCILWYYGSNLFTVLLRDHRWLPSVSRRKSRLWPPPQSTPIKYSIRPGLHLTLEEDPWRCALASLPKHL